MEQKSSFVQLIVALLTAGLVLLGVCFLLPWQKVDWGKLQLEPSQTITVVGTAESQERSQIAVFTAGVNTINDNKDEAINEVNSKMEEIIQAVKNFGISDKDIKTQNLSVYQQEETYYEEGRQKRQPGQWRVSNSITINLRNVDQASDLADLLTKSGANNIQGPNFSFEDTSEAESGLLAKAIEDARKKAEIIAEASGGKLGKIVSVVEGYQQSPVFRAFESGIGGMGGASPIEPGAGTISKTATVVFELE